MSTKFEYSCSKGLLETGTPSSNVASFWSAIFFVKQQIH
jgi:hypothetical protein